MIDPHARVNVERILVPVVAALVVLGLLAVLVAALVDQPGVKAAQKAFEAL